MSSSSSEDSIEQSSQSQVLKATGLGYTILGLASLFFFYDYLLNVSLGAMRSDVVQSLMISDTSFGMLAASFNLAYALMQIPVGVLMDKYSPRFLLTLAAAFSAGGAYIFSVADGLTLAIIARIFMGIGASFAFIGALRICSNWFPANTFAFLTGLVATVGMAGAAFGLMIVQPALELLQWRDSLYWASIIGFVICGLIAVIVRDYPTNLKNFVKPKTVSWSKVLNGLIEVVTQRSIWLAGIYSALIFIPMVTIGTTWGPTYFQQSLDFSKELSNFVTSLFFVGFLIGAPTVGWIADKYHNRFQVMFITGVITFALTVWLVYFPSHNAQVMEFIGLSLGFFSSGFILAFAYVRENVPSHLSSTAIGFVNTINTAIPYILQPIVGYILDCQMNDTVITSTGEVIHTMSQYQNAFIPVVLSPLFGVFLLYFVKKGE